MTGANETMYFDTDGRLMEQEQFHEEGVSDEIPVSLLSYFETSRSRAALCERLILEEPGDFLSDPQTHLDSVDLCFYEDVLESPNELQVIGCLTPGLTNTEALWTDNGNSEVEAGTDVEELVEVDLNEEQQNRGEGYRMEREKRLCEELEMEKQRRLRETEFQEELRRLEETEHLRQAEVELMVKRAQEKLEKEMLLQQEMMNDLKRRVEEERKRRIEEQTRFKEEQEKRRQEERRKTEQMRKRQKEELEQDEKHAIQTEEMSTVLKLKEDDKVRKGGFEKQSNKEEREKMEAERSTTKRERGVKMAEEMNVDKDSLGKRKARETNMRKENKSERKSKQEVDSVISKNVLTEDTTKRKTAKAKEVNKDLDKTKRMDEEVKTMNKNDKTVEMETSKEEGKQEMQHSRAKGVNCNVGIQSTTIKGQEKRNEIQKKQSREGEVNYKEDIVKLQQVIELQPKMCHEEGTVKDENDWKMNKASTFQQEDSAVDVKTRKDNGIKKLSISCNFLQKGLRMRQNTAAVAAAAADKSNGESEWGEEGSSKKTSLSCNDSQNEASIIQESSSGTNKKSKTCEDESSSVKTSSSFITSQNVVKISQETTQNGCSRKINLAAILETTEGQTRSKQASTSVDFPPNNDENMNEIYKNGRKYSGGEAVSDKVPTNGSQSVKNVSTSSYSLQNKSPMSSEATQYGGKDSIIQKGLFEALNKEDKSVKTSSVCGHSMSTICQETRQSDNSMSTNIKNEQKGSGDLLQKVSTSGKETGINGNNKRKVEYETVNEEEDGFMKNSSSSCQSLQNVFKVSEQHEKNDPVLTSSEDFFVQNKMSQQQQETPNITILEMVDEEKRSSFTRATAENGNQLKYIFVTLDEQDGKTKTPLNCGPIRNESNVKKQCENQKNTCQIPINVTVNGEVGQEAIQHSNENVNSGECGEIKASLSCEPLHSESFNSSERRQQEINQACFSEAGNGASDQTYSSNGSLKNVSTNSRETSQSENSIAVSMRSLCGEKSSLNKNSTSFGSRDNEQDGDEENGNRAAILEKSTRKEGKESSKTTSSSWDSLQNVSRVNGEQSGNEKNSNQTDVFEKESEDSSDKTSSRCNSFRSLPNVTKKASQQNNSSSQMSSIESTPSSNCNLLLNLSNNGNQQSYKKNKSPKNINEAVNEDTDGSNICFSQNESQNGIHKNVNEAAIFETGNEEGSLLKTTGTCLRLVSAISRETTQNDCIISTRFKDTKTLIGGVDHLINTTTTKEAVNEKESTLTLCLPERTEQKRMKWMKDCVSWSSLCLKNKRSKTGPVPNGRGVNRTAAGFISLPPLSPQTLLQATAKSSLQEVTTMTLQDLPGCSLSSLAQCSRLRSLTLRRCGLKALDSINQLRELCCVDVQENEISYVNCENMTCLRVLRLGHNKLTSVHGLNGADSLAVLDLSHNNVRRIAGLESLKSLQSLSLSHNQLISTKGLSAVSTLLHLDLSHNHLASVEGLENCALLGSLHLRSNSLSQPPALNNHVLLRELHLDDNSLSSLHSLTENWLPMMQHLSVAKNSITQLPCMSDFVSLETLDLQFNCISELSAVCQSLKLCRFIRELCVSENPLQQETGWRCTLQKAVPRLRSIDGHQTDSLSSPPAAPCFIPASSSFLSLCQTQLQQIREFQQRHHTETSTATSPLDVLKISCRHLNETRLLAEEHRFQHEYGDTSVTSESGRKVSSLEGENCGLHHQNLDLRNAAAALIQQRWRKHRQECMNKHSPSTDTGDRGEGGGRAAGQEPEAGRFCVDKRDHERDHAATVIQAFWRGISLRRRLASALAAASSPGGGQDNSFEEVDLDEFVFDEASLETEWSLRVSEDYTPRVYLKLERSQSPKAPGSIRPSHWSPPSAGDCGPKQAWTERDNSVERASPKISNRGQTPPPATVLTGLSERSEKIVEEWGFTDSHTALLMLKRAQKMKSKKQQHQKLKDPNVRLALFKSCASHMRPVEARNRPVPRNKLHLQVGEAKSEPEQTDGERQRTRRRRQTDNNTESEHFLPEMSWDVLNGGRVQLVADPGRRHVAAGLCLASQSCPGISRRDPEGHTRKEAPSPNRVSSAPCKKERISFRDSVVQLSGGWGSGKKRHKVTK